MRAFIAIPLPENIKNYISEIQKEFKKCKVSAKWVNPHNAHLTLKFLGKIEDEIIPSVESAIKETLKGLSIIRVNLSNFGFFPGERRPRVFFISTDKEETLQEIAYTLEDKLAPLGFNREHKFKSHITLARLKDRKNSECLFVKSKETKPENSFMVNSIVLYKSILTPRGAVYKEIFSESIKI